MSLLCAGTLFSLMFKKMLCVYLSVLNFCEFIKDQNYLKIGRKSSLEIIIVFPQCFDFQKRQ